MAAGPGFRALLRLARGETNSYFPDLVHDNHPVEPPAVPRTLHLADDMADKAVEFIRDAKVIDPESLLHVPRPQADTPSPGPAGMGGRYKGLR